MAAARLHARVASSSLVCLTAALLLSLALAPRVLADPGVEDRLAAALALRHDGYYEEALAALQALAPEGGPQVLAALAESYELVGDWAGAGEVWHQVASAADDDRLRQTAVFRRASALQQTGDYVRAARLYRYFLQLRPETLAGRETLERIAVCYGAAGNWRAAARFFTEALAETRGAEQRARAVPLHAEALVLSGDGQAALALFEAERPGVPDAELPGFLYGWALAERSSGLEQDGLDRLLALVAGYPRSDYAHPALVLLVEAGAPVNEYLRGVVEYYAGAYEPALAAFQRYIDADPEGHRGSAHYYAGLSYRALGDYESAIAEFDLLISTHPGDPDLPAGWLAKGETQVRMGEGQAAADTYKAFADAFPEDKLAPEALLRAVQQLETLGSSEAAIEVYNRIQGIYSGAALMYYRASRWADAEGALRGAVAACGECADLGRYRFWLARSLLAQGEKEEANALLQAVAGNNPLDYYSYRAHILLSGETMLPGSGGGLLLEPGEGARTEAEAWLRQRFDPGWQPGQMPAAVATDPRFAAAQEYLELGLRQEAVSASLALAYSLRRDPIAEYALALWLRDRSLYRPSIQAAANILYTQGWSRALPSYIWRLVYPSYFGDLVLAETASSGVDPLLFFSLMRQESLFDPLIGSSAGAQGLAQVMPATGEWIAGQLGDSDYTVTDLMRPHVAVRYGVYYLSQQLAYLGDPLPALAAYNAGPGNAARWQEIAGGDPDLFYETIAFGETKRYLNAILPNYHYYAWLYAGLE